ncbi:MULTISPECIES: SDR family oxidoreductase [Cyanophyceae]|uniref:SDR family oxidoreductase n=1 Tax=Cyanophyceae TaxID=3028117 RepID=UPI0016886CF9|nr:MULTISPECIES: SDR family oxidoreductase [Cyanophyceae]MBD1917215.1 SDR family oxidoreductase [Phormidium sp. FACHB-77]MBD2030746.1 SDR family oxidoreductase [Phormidium sp. FACHB-322]MBD2050146.1 SDR family oxidoreductase [Leptolyngbya sp. FACHB-60]
MQNPVSSDLPRRALVTGASRGIGKAIAQALALAGYDVALLGRSLETLQPVQEELSTYGVLAKAYAVDLAQEGLQPRLAAVLADFGPLSVVVNNAGMGYTGPLATMPLADWQQVMDLNVTSVLQCIQAVLPMLRQGGGGTIVNIASIAARSAFPDWGAYTVSKAAIVALSRVLAAEERAHGIRVVTVSPGAVNTPIWDTDTVQADFDRSSMLTPEIVAQTVLHTILLPPEAVIEDLTLMPAGGAL